jgi:hypothetical protein
MKKEFENIIKTVKDAILDLVPRRVSVLPLHFTRVTGKFDSLTRPSFKGGVSGKISH